MEQLEFLVPAPGASLPPSQVPLPGEEGEDEDNMHVEQERKRIRGCMENGEDPDAPGMVSSSGQKNSPERRQNSSHQRPHPRGGARHRSFKTEVFNQI
eukprot:6485146-Amphidinium_carterae.2